MLTDQAIEKRDRRFVTIQLTSFGLEQVNQVDDPIEKWNRQWMRNISSKETKALIQLCERLRLQPEHFLQLDQPV